MMSTVESKIHHHQQKQQYPGKTGTARKRNGCQLVSLNPEERKLEVMNQMQKFPGHCVVVVNGPEQECMKFLVSLQSMVSALVDHATRHMGYAKNQISITFEGVHYPDTNLVKDIYQRKARDDCILYGKLILNSQWSSLSSSWRD